MNKIKNFLNKYSLGLLITITVANSIAADAWSYQNQFIAAYGDARSHLNIARSVVDNLTPGLAQLGGVWLPLYHVLMMPFTLNNVLYHSGLAGTIVSSVFYVLSSILMFEIINKIIKNRFLSFLSALLFALNTNVLYLQSAAMTETTSLFFIIFAIYYFVKWQSSKKINDIVILSLIVFFGTFTRYENWVMVPAVFLGIILTHIGRRNKFKTSIKELESELIIFSYLSFFGVFLWLLWNLLIFHNPLYFLHSNFSSEAYQVDAIKGGLDKPYHDLLNAVKYYLFSIAHVSTWVLIISGFVGFFYSLLKRRSVSILALGLLSFSVFLFESYSLFKGNTIINIPDLFPFTYYNIRYGVYSLPFFIIFTSFLLTIKYKIIKLLVIILIIIEVVIPFYKFAPITLTEPLLNLQSDPSRNFRNAIPDDISFLKNNYKGGLILTSFGASGDTIFYSGIDVKNFITEGNRQYWTESLKSPQKYATWIVMKSDKKDVRNSLGVALYGSPKISKYFNLIYNKNGNLIYKKK